MWAAAACQNNLLKSPSVFYSGHLEGDCDGGCGVSGHCGLSRCGRKDHNVCLQSHTPPQVEAGVVDVCLELDGNQVSGSEASHCGTAGPVWQPALPHTTARVRSAAEQKKNYTPSN